MKRDNQLISEKTNPNENENIKSIKNDRFQNSKKK